jgi:hypothetical protein
MPTPPPDLLYALRRFVLAVDEKNTDPSMLGHAELSAGQPLMAAIEKIIDARVKAALAKR